MMLKPEKTGTGNMNLIWNHDSGYVENLSAEKHNTFIYIELVLKLVKI
jgi:hypothetical protein